MSLKMVRRGVASALGIGAVLLAGVACAQEEGEAAAEGAPVAPKGKREALQLTLTGSVLEYQKQTLKPDPVSGSSPQPAEQESSTTTFGVLGSGYGVGVGYLWDDVLLGARAQLTSSTHSPSGGGEEKTTTIDFFPRVEYVLDGGSARPFIAGLVGIQHAFSSTDSTTALGGGDSLTTHSESSFTRFGFGAAFGIHAFLNQSVSIDPEFAVLYAAGSGTSKLSGTGDGALPSSSAAS